MRVIVKRLCGKFDDYGREQAGLRWGYGTNDHL